MLRQAISQPLFSARATSRLARTRYQLHCRATARRLADIARPLSYTACKANSTVPQPAHTSPADPVLEASSAPAMIPQTELTFEAPQPRLSLTFTCTVTDCSTRSTHEFARRSYERGIVIVQCPGCKNRHLIADHIGWFKESTEEGKLKTVEDLVRAKGEKVRRGRLDAGGVVEYMPE
ncbi:Uncharacterized protein C24H6.02c [Grifola frondosa]|uniref:Uncharacterized protein C24H6.02c n=1 Tax=Grifola frondosa TaxID=5627 RepID=A0A1C7M9K4_GRIFR|nr:Uncharacterized protein C24H6.02c [Grifola frondosa]